MSHDGQLTRIHYTMRELTGILQKKRYCTPESSGIKFKLGHVLRENNLTKRSTSLLSGERKKKKRSNNCKRFLRHNKTLNCFRTENKLYRHDSKLLRMKCDTV